MKMGATESKLLLVGLGLALASGDPAWAQKKLTKIEKQAVQRAVVDTAYRFEVPAGEADEAWGRATEWLTLVTGMRMDVVTDSVIQTYRENPKASFEKDPYCTGNRVDLGDSYRFTMLCGADRLGLSGDYTAVLSRYTRTGDPTCLASDRSAKKKEMKVTARCLIECDETKSKCWTKGD